MQLLSQVSVVLMLAYCATYIRALSIRNTGVKLPKFVSKTVAAVGISSALVASPIIPPQLASAALTEKQAPVTVRF